MAREGSGSRQLTTTLDRDVQDPVWASDGSGLTFLYEDQGNGKIGFVGLDGAVRKLADDAAGLSIDRPYTGGQFSAAPDGRFAFTLSAPDHLADVALGDRRAGAPRRLTRLNDDLLGARNLATLEELWLESSHDARRVHAWIAKPPDFDPGRKYPLILEIHGGPFAAYGDVFSADVQLYAAAGYVVLYVNPRGSTSYGEEFGNLIHHAYPGHDYDDLMSAVDAVVGRGFVDPERLYVTGGSGGGVLTAWIVGKTDRFRAAVVAKPVIDWTSFVLTADAANFFYKYWFPAAPWEEPEAYWSRSPLSLVGNVTTPTMLLTGEADYRTPISESEQYYQALKIRKVDTAMVRIPGASHSIDERPSQLIAKAAHILAWFDRHGGQGETEGGETP
jgi:acylaminoacyl-peptidase